MSKFMFVTDAVRSAALLNDMCIGNGVEKISVTATAADDVSIDLKIVCLRQFSDTGREGFYELAKSIACLDINDA